MNRNIKAYLLMKAIGYFQVSYLVVDVFKICVFLALRPAGVLQ